MLKKYFLILAIISLILTPAAAARAQLGLGGLSIQGIGPLLSQNLRAKMKAALGQHVPVHDSILTEQETQLTLTEILIKAAVSAVKQRLINRLVDQTVSFIQGGGKPRFVTDWKGFLQDAANEAAGDFAEELGAGFLCSPFNLQVQFALLPTKPFSQLAACTLDDIVSNINAFYQDFRNGGWIAYSAAWEPQNNVYGSLLLAWNEKNKRIAAKVTAAKNEALAGGGFLGVKECDENGKNCRITTPGKVLGAAVEKAVGSDFDFIVNAEDLGQYAEAIANALINRIIKEGITGIQSITSSKDTAESERIARRNFERSKNNIISRLNEALLLFQEAHAALQAAIASRQTYKNDLENLKSQFASKGPICSTVTAGGEGVSVTTFNRDDVIADIDNEINDNNSEIATLQQDASTIQQAINRLQDAVAKIKPLSDPASDSIRLNDIFAEVGDIASPFNARNTRDGAQAANAETQQRITQKLQEFNTKLSQCR